MISSLSPNSTAFLNGLNIIQRRSQRAQLELTTGLRINDVSDDPSQVALLFETRSQLSHNTQITANLNQVKAEVDTGEGAIQSAVTLVEQAQSLGSQGQTGFASSDTRSQIAAALGGVLQQLVSVANTTQGGRYIFGGDTDQTAPYTIDTTQANPISAYAGSASTRQVESPDGTQFTVALTAQTIFDSADPTTNVFQAVNNLRTALLNNDQAGIDAAIPTLKTADSYLNTQLSSYGVAQNRIAAGLSFAANLDTQLKTRTSSIQDADLTQAITEFQQAQTEQQAALVSRAKLPRSSLFDYLA